ncbi:hypothetical protein JHK86_037556 [Glycine max]|nr:hypothetical protein JHK86_037556 [Glycine max]
MEETIKNLSGTSLLVSSVQELAKQNLSSVPQRYIQPQNEDIVSLLSVESCSSKLAKLHLACKQWGFFQLINHGVSSSLVEKVK